MNSFHYPLGIVCSANTLQGKSVMCCKDIAYNGYYIDGKNNSVSDVKISPRAGLQYYQITYWHSSNGCITVSIFGCFILRRSCTSRLNISDTISRRRGLWSLSAIFFSKKNTDTSCNIGINDNRRSLHLLQNSVYQTFDNYPKFIPALS